MTEKKKTQRRKKHRQLFNIPVLLIGLVIANIVAYGLSYTQRVKQGRECHGVRAVQAECPFPGHQYLHFCDGSPCGCHYH